MAFSVAKENTFLGKIFNIFLKYIFAPIVRFLWLKKITGRENLPKNGPFIIAANHQSYLDFIMLTSVMPRQVRFLSAEKFFTSKFWRPIMELTGQIKVERDAADKTEAKKRVLTILENGEVIGIFPQGTRSRSGKIEKTYTGVANFAVEANVPVVPIGIIGAFRIYPPHAKRPILKKIMEINIGKPMLFTEYYSGDNKETFRVITNKIMKEISRLANKEYKEE